jgi:hypothetical protein
MEENDGTPSGKLIFLHFTGYDVENEPRVDPVRDVEQVLPYDKAAVSRIP